LKNGIEILSRPLVKIFTACLAHGKACAEVHFMILRWIAAMLSNCTVRAEIRGVSSTMMVRRGCPQGGVLSPVLWNMVINFMLSRLNNESLSAQGFAEDISIVINEKFLSTVCELMQKALFIRAGHFEI
jgi:hypothetical protein